MAVSMHAYDSHANNQKKFDQNQNFNKQNFNNQQSDSSQSGGRQWRKKEKCKVECYICKQEGHRYSQCPHRFNARVMEEHFKQSQEKQRAYDEKKSLQN